MKFISLVRVEFQKIRRSKILLILLAATFILWLPSVINADAHFHMQDIGITPENSFFIQGFMGMTWFISPAVMTVCTVLITQTERTSNGILKMLALPVNTAGLAMAKYVVLLALSALYFLLNTGAYYISAAIASATQSYDFLLAPGYVLEQAGYLFLSSLPMLAVFWLIAVCIRTPVFSVGIGLASIVPSVLFINTKIWFLYPMCYPFYVLTVEYGRLAENMADTQLKLVPWIPAAAIITIICLAAACLSFGRAERK